MAHICIQLLASNCKQYCGGGIAVAYLVVLLIITTTFINLRRLKKEIPYFLIVFAFSLEVILFRYFRGERSLYLFFFSHPSVILLSAWAIYKIIKINKIVGISLLAIITIVTLNKSVKNIQPAEITLSEVTEVKSHIISTFPNSSFNIGVCAQYGSVGHPIAYLIYKEKREEINGVNIQVCEIPGEGINWDIISKKNLYGKYKDGTLFFTGVSTEKTYQETTEWWKENPPPKSSGGLWKFLKENAFGK